MPQQYKNTDTALRNFQLSKDSGYPQPAPCAVTRAEQEPSEGRRQTPRTNSRFAPTAATAGRGRGGGAPLQAADPASCDPAARQTFAAEQKRRVTPHRAPRGAEGGKEKGKVPGAAGPGPRRPPSPPPARLPAPARGRSPCRTR